MALLTGPLFHLKASGQIAKTMVVYHRKTQIIARAYVVPHDPQTPEQLAIRQQFAQAVSARKQILNEPFSLVTWCRYQNTLTLHPAYNNAQVSAILQATRATPHPAFLTSAQWLAPNSLQLQFTCTTCGLPGHEPSTFTVWLGDTPHTTIPGPPTFLDGDGRITFNPFALLPACRYVYVTSQQLRSGMLDFQEDFAP